MKYRWKAIFERSHQKLTANGSITTYEQEEQQGKFDEIESGQHALQAVIEQTKKVGNIIHLEIERAS